MCKRGILISDTANETPERDTRKNVLILQELLRIIQNSELNKNPVTKRNKNIYMPLKIMS
jgi:hypothetical protein